MVEYDDDDDDDDIYISRIVPNKTTYLTDIAVPNTNNVQTTYTTKITKHQDLRHEVRDIWGMEKILIIPLVISAIGIVAKTLATNLEILNIDPNTYIEIQKATILNTCHIVRKFLDMTH